MGTCIQTQVYNTITHKGSVAADENSPPADHPVGALGG